MAHTLPTLVGAQWALAQPLAAALTGYGFHACQGCCWVIRSSTCICSNQ